MICALDRMEEMQGFLKKGLFCRFFGKLVNVFIG